MCLHADSVDDGVGATTLRQLAHALGDVVDFFEVDRFDLMLAREREALGNKVDRDDEVGTAMAGDAATHLADGAEAEDGYGPARRYVCVCDGLPRGRKDIGEVEEALVGQPRRDLDRPEVGLW